MDNDIDIYEFEWWAFFSAILIAIALSISLIVLGLWLQEITMNWRRGVFIFLGTSILVYSIIGLWSIYSVPRLIKFKQNNIHVVFPLRREKIFHYTDISRIIIIDRITSRSQAITKSLSPFRVRIYFVDGTIKIRFNPDRMMAFSAVLAHFKSKGLESIIEYK